MASRQIWRLCRRLGVVCAVVAIALIVSTQTHAPTVAPTVSLPSGGVVARVEPPKLEVVPKPSVTARVLANGQVAPDVEVSITDGSKPVLARAWTDREGMVKFDDLPQGPF